jgi:hypothetical protein
MGIGWHGMGWDGMEMEMEMEMGGGCGGLLVLEERRGWVVCYNVLDCTWRGAGPWPSGWVGLGAARWWAWWHGMGSEM